MNACASVDICCTDGYNINCIAQCSMGTVLSQDETEYTTIQLYRSFSAEFSEITCTQSSQTVLTNKGKRANL